MINRIRIWWKSSNSSRGQILILAAFFGVTLTGMVGLSIDLGYTFAERRTVQNAADASALAGARALTKWSTSNPNQNADTDVANIVSHNKMNSSTSQTYDCIYVDDANTKQGNCTDPVPPKATGVKVTVHETHSTFFVRAIPSGPKTVTTSATATAHVEGITLDGGLGTDSPFIICGMNGNLVTGGSEPILLNDGTINPDAYGDTFYIHAPNSVSRCGMQPNQFKGLADNDANYCLSIPGVFKVTNGTVTGPTLVKIIGYKGCASGLSYDQLNDCVLIVPIASMAQDGGLYVVNVAPFLISSCHVNCQQATLLADYVIQPDGQGQWTSSNGWKPGDTTMVMIRLTS